MNFSAVLSYSEVSSHILLSFLNVGLVEPRLEDFTHSVVKFEAIANQVGIY